MAAIPRGRREEWPVLFPCPSAGTESAQNRTEFPVIAFQTPMLWIGVLEGLAIKGDRLFESTRLPKIKADACELRGPFLVDHHVRVCRVRLTTCRSAASGALDAHSISIVPPLGIFPRFRRHVNFDPLQLTELHRLELEL